MKTENKKYLKEMSINVVLSLIVSAIAYFTFTYFNTSIKEMLIPIIFLLVLIYLEILDKK